MVIHTSFTISIVSNKKAREHKLQPYQPVAAAAATVRPLYFMYRSSLI